jgi:hypothetical protein
MIFDDAGLLPPDGGTYLSSYMGLKTTVFANEGFKYPVVHHLSKLNFTFVRVESGVDSSTACRVLTYEPSVVVDIGLLGKLREFSLAKTPFVAQLRQASSALQELGTYSTGSICKDIADDMKTYLVSIQSGHPFQGPATDITQGMHEVIKSYSSTPELGEPVLENHLSPKVSRLLEALRLAKPLQDVGGFRGLVIGPQPILHP